MPKKAQELIMGTVVGVRLTGEEAARLDALVARIPIATKHRIARAALLRGLSDIERDPALLLADPDAESEGVGTIARPAPRRPTRSPRPACPKCGSRAVLRLLLGMPDPDRDAAPGVAFFGCCIFGDGSDPAWRCGKCGTDFGRQDELPDWTPRPAAKERTETLLPVTKSKKSNTRKGARR